MIVADGIFSYFERRAQRHGPVELARNSGEPAVQDVPSVEPWELSGYAIGAGLPDRVNGAAIASEVDDLCRLLGSLDAEWLVTKNDETRMCLLSYLFFFSEFG